MTQSPDQSTPRGQRGAGFGKRGRVDLAPRPIATTSRFDDVASSKESPEPQPSSVPTWMLGAGAAAMLAVLVFGTGGGGGFLGGLLGGLLATKMFGTTKPNVPTATASNAPRTAQAEKVQRGGFGNTGSSGGWLSGG